MGAATALWFVEDPTLFPDWVAQAPAYDAVFTIGEREGIRAFRAVGAREVHFLPTAAPDDRLSPVSVLPGEIAALGDDTKRMGDWFEHAVLHYLRHGTVSGFAHVWLTRPSRSSART